MKKPLKKQPSKWDLAKKEATSENIDEEKTTKSREQIRNVLRSSKTMAEIDEQVKAILPDYC